jgi:predicted nucleic acid-binding Zn finger protein
MDRVPRESSIASSTLVRGGDAVTPVERWQGELADVGKLTPAVVQRILAVHDDRGRQAIEAVSERRVKEYRDFVVVVGFEDEYIVEDGCTCRDSEYNLDPDDPTELCWHVLAAEIARRVDAVDHHDMWYSDVREFL